MADKCIAYTTAWQFVKKYDGKKENKPSPAKVGSNKLRVYIGFDHKRSRQTQLRVDQA